MDRIILPITPQTWVRIRSGKGGDHVLFNIPEVCTRGENGGCCDDYFQTGYCSHTLSKHSRARKRRLEKYNKYRLDLFDMAKKAGFQLPSMGWSLYFYMPMPARWSKKKKEELHGQPHLKKPDQSNLLKAFEDALSIMDEQVAQMSGLGKFWVNQPEGYIEIKLNQPVYNPFQVDLQPSMLKVDMEDIESRRERKRKRKEELRAEKKKAAKKPEKPENKFRKHRKSDKLL